MGVVALKKNALTLLGSFVAAGLIVVATSRTTLATSREEGSFRDCPRCLQMRVIPSGSFEMGSEISAKVRSDDEGPRHRVTFAQPFAISAYEVTREQFGQFVEATGHDTGNECHSIVQGEWKLSRGLTWREPGYAQTLNDPVVCVSWSDAQAFVAWMRKTTGKPYRLPSEAEWEYVARAGVPERRVTHDDANFGTKDCCGPKVDGKDRWMYTAPVGSFHPNAFGLYDVQGNVWEWVGDCYNDSYQGAPADGSARTSDCSMADHRGVRGGGWGDDAPFLRPAYRLRAVTDNRYFTLGFRVARDLQ